MIDALISGRIYRKPEARTAKNGSAFVTAKLRAPTRDGEALFVNVIAFNATTIDALLALEANAAVALIGELKATAYLGTDGNARPSLDLLANQCLTPYQVKRRRQSVVKTNTDGAPQSEAPRQTDPDFNDISF